MYVCNLKTNKNEQTQLLEMCGNAGINSWNNAGFFIKQPIQLFKKGWGNIFLRPFLFS